MFQKLFASISLDFWNWRYQSNYLQASRAAHLAMKATTQAEREAYLQEVSRASARCNSIKRKHSPTCTHTPATTV